MVDARLIRELERRGFQIEFPAYSSNEEVIIAILNEGDSRLNLSIPLFLTPYIDYPRLIKKLKDSERKELNNILIISKDIFKKERLDNNLKSIIKEKNINLKYSKKEFEEYFNSFKESQKQLQRKEQSTIEKQTKLRLNLDLNKSLNVLFSPAKIRIMTKIFNHEPLTNTELKYYYRAISNINKSVLKPSLQDYLRLIETSKKISS